MTLTKRTVENLAGLHPQFKALATAFVEAANEALDPDKVRVEVISGLRSWRQQAELFARGRTKPGRIVTKARPGSSWHNFGLAIDLGLFRDGLYLDEAKPSVADKLYLKLEAVSLRFGLEWAGRWKSFTETPHYQKTYGNSLATLRERMKDCEYDVRKLKL